MRILIVDDHQILRRGVRGLLESHPGFEVCGEAVDGLDAIARAQELHPDAIVMDISMPNLNGLEATQEIHRLLPQVRIVILSQHNTPEMIREAVKAGAHGYVVKSSISTDLIAALQRVTQQAEAQPVIAKPQPTIAPDVKEVLQRGAVLENALRESQERLRSLVEYQSAVMNNMVEGLYTVDTNGLVTNVNPAAEAILGWTREELLGRKMHDVTHYRHPDGTPYPAADCPGLLVIQTGIPVRHHEDMFIRKDGSFVPVVFSASRLEEGGRKPLGLVVSFRDETDARRARERVDAAARKLQVSNEHLQLVTSTMAAAVTRCSRDLTYQWANQGYADWLQRPLDEIIGHSIESVIGTHALHSLAPQFERVLGGEEIRYEQEIELPTLGRRWIMAGYTPTFAADGRADGWVGVTQDITERKRHELALQRSEAALAAEIHALAELNELSSRLWSVRTLQEGLGQILAGVLGLLGADKGVVQLLDNAGDLLRIAAQQGIDEDFLDSYREIPVDQTVASARAIRSGEAVIVDDMRADTGYTRVWEAAQLAGIRAVTCVPLISNEGRTLGIVSAQFPEVHRPSTQELDRLDLYIRQAADFVERFKARQKSRKEKSAKLRNSREGAVTSK